MAEQPGAQQSGTVGQVSPDGRWRWDGQAWQPVEAQPSPSAAAVPSAPQPQPVWTAPATYYAPAPVPARARSGWGKALVVGVIALVVGGTCGLAVGGSGKNNNSTTTSSNSTTASDLASKYTDAITADLPTLEKDDSAIGTACGKSNFSGCKAALQTDSKDTQTVLDDISALDVPACMSATNEQLATALELAIDGDNEAIDGINANDAPKVVAATALINLSTDHLTKATDQATKAAC